VIIARSVWGARPASLPKTAMRLPATQVFIHHSVTQVSDMPYADMRAIEAVGLQRFGQFPYSYVVHPKDGEILEGCGLFRGAHTAQRNSTSFGICWAGNYEERNPKVQQLDATRWLIHHLTAAGHLVPGADILGHRDVDSTACPGRKLYDYLPVLRHPWEVTMPPDEQGQEIRVNARIVNLVAHPSGNGYWIVTADGAVFAFGEAKFWGRVHSSVQ
jgi:hypothetical protein